MSNIDAVNALLTAIHFNRFTEIEARHGALWEARLDRLRTLNRRRIRLGLVGRLANGVLLGGVLGLLAWMVSTGRATVAEAGLAAGAVVSAAERRILLTRDIGLLKRSMVVHGAWVRATDRALLARLHGGRAARCRRHHAGCGPDDSRIGRGYVDERPVRHLAEPELPRPGPQQ